MNLLNCKTCNKKVLIPNYRVKTFRFCSRKCGYIWNNINNRIQKTCIVCNNIFSVISFRNKTAKYCSRKCYYQSLKGRGSVSLSCVVCGKTFNRPPSRAIYKNPVCNKVCRGLLMRKSEPTIKSYRRWIKRRNLIQKCVDCGFDKVKDILIIHHKDFNRTNNHPSNFIVLCPNCHSIRHLN